MPAAELARVAPRPPAGSHLAGGDGKHYALGARSHNRGSVGTPGEGEAQRTLDEPAVRGRGVTR